MERDEMIDTVIASHSSTGSRRGPVLIPVLHLRPDHRPAPTTGGRDDGRHQI